LAWAFIARRGHPQYLGRAPLDHLAALIRQGRGEAGPCRDYLSSTIEHLEALGLGCDGLKRLLALADSP
jgi:cation transport protein ChaC